MKLNISSNHFPLFDPNGIDDVKDPCPVFDGSVWHVFGSGGTVTTETWKIFHATAPGLTGPWRQQGLIDLPVEGSGVAAPGVVFDDGFHMFIQTEFMKPGGRCEHLTSPDGFTWTRQATAIFAMPDTDEDGIYDPHPAIIDGEKYIVYSAMAKFSRVPQPDIYLAKSTSGSWYGPWERLGKILDHDDVAHHNPRTAVDYEWGIEGPQLVQLHDGRVMLNATCFLPSGVRGTRQRVFFAVADNVKGPYRSIGPIIEPQSTGENGHSTVLMAGNELTMLYQSRMETTNQRWRYGLLKGVVEILRSAERSAGTAATEQAA